ncbi:MAG: PAS domain S-box protein [Desulfobacteraceae bacterium]
MATVINILHLEDDPADAKLVQAKLAEADFNCRIHLVHTRDEFETVLCKDEIDIILADYQMPMNDGISILRLTLESRPDIPFIFVSGAIGEEAAIEVLTQGATDYVHKQDLSRLATAVKRALQEAQHLRARKFIEEALFFVAQRGWMADAENFFDALAWFLGDGLDVDYVVIDRLDEEPDTAETLALYAKGAIVPNMRYDLKGTPCENVMGKQLCAYPRDVQQLFPEDTLLAEMGVESYIGIPLWDSTGRPIGLIALMDSQPLADDKLATQLLQLVATRAAAELERAQSDRILRTREQEFRTLAENSPDNIARYDTNGRIVYVNPAMEMSLGCPASEMLGRTPMETRRIDTAEMYQERIADVLATGETSEMDLYLPDRGKGASYYNIRFAAERNGDGAVTGVLALGRDLTEKMRAEKELRASETKYRIVADNTYDWEFWTDENGQYAYISPSSQRITGFSAEAFKENPDLLDSIIHPDDLAHYRNHLIETQAKHSVESVEFRIFDKEGLVRWIEQFCQPVFDEKGNWLGTRGSNRDITHRKVTEHLKQLTATILGILNEPAALTDTINRVLATIQQELAFDAVGLRLQEREDFPYFASTGFPDDFLVAENTLVVRDQEGGLCRDEDGNVCLECTCGLVISGKTDPTNPLFTPGGSCWTNNSLPLLDLPADQDPRLHPRNLCIHKDFLSVALIPIRANHKIIGLLQLNDRKRDRLTREMISYFEDICGSIGLSLMKKQAEEEIHRLNRELEQRVRDRTAALEAANQELEGFVYSISHDLRAPLRHIDGFVNLLRANTEGVVDEHGRHYMESLATAAVRMGRLVDDLLSFSRMGRTEMSKSPVDLAVLVTEVIHELEPEAEGRKVHWRVGELPVVAGDQTMLRTVLGNLLSNGLKFTRPREPAEIEVGRAPGKQDEVVIFVRDNGVGFDPAYADKLFGVFQRLHRTEEFEGTGIGLANVHRIIARHGGRTWAEGGVDRGATIYFSLPAVRS